MVSREAGGQHRSWAPRVRPESRRCMAPEKQAESCGCSFGCALLRCTRGRGTWRCRQTALSANKKNNGSLPRQFRLPEPHSRTWPAVTKHSLAASQKGQNRLPNSGKFSLSSRCNRHGIGSKTRPWQLDLTSNLSGGKIITRVRQNVPRTRTLLVFTRIREPARLRTRTPRSDRWCAHTAYLGFVCETSSKSLRPTLRSQLFPSFAGTGPATKETMQFFYMSNGGRCYEKKIWITKLRWKGSVQARFQQYGTHTHYSTVSTTHQKILATRHLFDTHTSL